MDPRKQRGQGQGKYKATDFDMDKLRSTLKQFVRDWSEDVRVSVIQRCSPSVIDAPPGESRARCMLRADEKSARGMFRGSRQVTF